MEKLVEVKEGLVRLMLPSQALKPLAERKHKPRVFYNPEATLNRDVAVLAVDALSKRLGGELRVCDALAGCGVRGIRFLAESLGVKEAVLNDLNPEAVKLISSNLELNGLSGRAKVYNLDARILLLRRDVRLDGFHLVDIDPFGSPAPFIQPAILALRKQGVLAATSTDTAPLSGTYPKVCLRRYGAKPLKTEYHPEVAIRILLGFIARNCTMFNRGFNPLLVHKTTQYIRVYGEVIPGVKAAEGTIEKIGYLNHCFRCLNRFFVDFEVSPGGLCPNCAGELDWAGPLWVGKMFDEAFCWEVLKSYKGSHLSFKKELGKLLETITLEAHGAATYYVTDRLSSLLKMAPPSKRALISALKDLGYQATPTHFNSRGIRTDAPSEAVLKAFKIACPSKPSP